MPKQKEHRIEIEPFRWDATDPLAPEYNLVMQLVLASLKSGWKYYEEIDLEATSAGKQILAATPEASARLVLALVAYARHYDELVKRVRALAQNETQRWNCHHSPEWENVWPFRQVSAQTLRRIMRRKLPLSSEHLIALADWVGSAEWQSDVLYPLKAFVKAVEAHGLVAAGDDALRSALSHLINVLRKDSSKESPKLAQRIEQVLDSSSLREECLAGKSAAQINFEPDASQPAPVGSPDILVALKVFLGIPAEESSANAEVVGIDQFPLRTGSSLREEHEIINTLLPEILERGNQDYYNPNFAATSTGKAILDSNAPAKGRLVLALAERSANTYLDAGEGDHRIWQSKYALPATFSKLLQCELTLSRNQLFDLLLYLSALIEYHWVANVGTLPRLLTQLETFATSAPLTPGERHVLHRLRCQSIRAAPFGRPAEDAIRITKILRDRVLFALVPGEAWSDAVNADLAPMDSRSRGNWLELLRHAATATGSRPSAKWLKTAKQCLAQVRTEAFVDAALRWFPLVNEPRTIRTFAANASATIHEDNATCLRGLLWISPEVASPDLIRAIGALTVSCYRKIPGVGPRAIKVGNAGVHALSQINDPIALGQLALLKIKVKFGSAQKEIEKAFNVAAERSGLPREELEEMSVPTYGLTEVGVCEEKMGNFTARLTITGTDSTELVWLRPDGKAQRGVPAEVKASYVEDLKALQAYAKDIQKMLPAQRDRIDSLFLQQRSWSINLWRERYLDHPLIGTLARRILWQFNHGSDTTVGIWFNGRFVDVDLKPIAIDNPNTSVRLWHPIDRSTEEIVAWRSWLDAQKLQQPFKQVHREIYVLTDAERTTRVYSNRYAAHVLRQHQFNALCALRGWKNKLRLMVDDEYPPASLHLPQWNLRAEFWIEGIAGDYGVATNESGVFLHVSTDQVRFYRIDAAQRTAHAGGGGYHPSYRETGAEPVPLDQIPPLVFSEVMRDVDMFVGVASVGNDPTWADGGPQGRYRDYWQGVSFGELNATAKTRKDVLQRLVPKLKIAGQCSFDEKFLVVKGSLRTYKIHLGSGNILMAPNDQYLCIVAKQSETKTGDVFLPFEGDRTLSVIISKAFLLAADSKITDPTILNQIRPQ